jgi:very-short-patch-repair endonuclease
MLWKHVKGPDLEREYRFHHERRWRADFAQMEARVLIEIEGGIWVNGRHNRAAGFNADLEKYLEASLAGWRVFRFGPDQITMENVERVARLTHFTTLPSATDHLAFAAAVKRPAP